MGRLSNFKKLIFGRKAKIDHINKDNFPFDYLSSNEAESFFFQQGNVLACNQEQIIQRIEDTPESVLPDLYESFQYSWCKYWMSISSRDLKLTVSVNFILLSYDDDRRNEILLRFAEKAHDHILDNLQLKQTIPGKILVFHLNRNDYYDLENSLARPDYEDGVMSGGMFVRSIIPYMVFHSEQGQILPDLVMVHELTHALLSPNDLPMWLDDALACTMEKTITGESYYDWSLEQGLKNIEFWDSLSIQKFWTGESFNINECQDFSYLLAQGLLNVIIKDYRNQFRDFVNDAKRKDAGESAARKYLGTSLEQVANKYLGKGSWQPNQSYIDSCFGV